MRSSTRHGQIRRGMLVCVLLLAASSGVRGQISVKGYTPARGLPASPRETPRSRAHAELRILEAPAVRLGPLTAEERRGPSGDRFEKRERIGAVRQAPPSAVRAMAFTRVPEGVIGLLRVVSPGARGLRLRLQNLSLPAGATLFVLSAADPEEYYGPFRDRGPGDDGEIWTPDVRGESAIIEVFVPTARTASPPFTLPEVGHLFFDANQQQQPGPCHTLVPSEWAEAAKSVGRVQTASSKGVFACTGVLLNTTNNSGIPYFLTANHCVPTQAEAGRLLIRWLDAGGSPTNETTSYGGALLSTGQASDYSLVRLNAVPSGLRFSGWTTAAPGATTSVASIHHPYDSFQRFSRGRILGEGCGGFIENAFCGNYLPVRWEAGITEPGSSGGPLWTGSPADPQLAGILSGGASSCPNTQGVDYFGRFDAAFAAFASYLTGEGCAWELSESERIVKAAGDSLTVELKARSTNKSCSWTATSNVPWIALTTPASGSGETSIRFTVAANPGTDPRAGAITIAGQQYVLTQLGVSAESCRPTQITIPATPATRTLSATSCRSILNRGAYAERFTFEGLAGQQLLPSVNSGDFDTMLLILNPDGSILGFNDDAGGTGSAILGGPSSGDPIVLPATGAYTVEVTSYEPGEAGLFHLNLQRLCLFRMPVRNFIVPPEGAALEIDVLGPPDCAFEAASTIPWVKISSGGAYTGAQKVKVTVEPTTEYAVASWQDKRVAVFRIAGQDVEIIQRLKCGRFTLLKTSAGVGALPGIGERLSFISTGLHCDWTLTTDVPWIGFDGPASGRGYIETSYRIEAANLGGAPRVGRIFAGEQAFTVTQQGIGTSCQSASIAIGQTVTGTFDPQCRSLTSQPELATPASYYKFSGTAGQRIAIAAFTTGASPEGETIESAWLAPPSGRFAGFWRRERRPEGLFSLQFPEAGYFTLPETGEYTIQLGAFRDRPLPASPFTLHISEVTGAACDLQLSSTREARAGAGGSGRIDVRSTGACAWKTVSLSPWITITAGANGSGTGAVGYNVAPLAGTEPRAGALLIGGNLVTVMQSPRIATTVSSASYLSGAAPLSLLSIFGSGMTTRTEAATSQPLPFTLGGATVKVFLPGYLGIECPLIFVSPDQINLLVPFSQELIADAMLEIRSEAGAVTHSLLTMTRVFPGLFSANADGRGVAAAQTLRVKADGSQTWEDVFVTEPSGRRIARPIALGAPGEQVFLILYGTGFRSAAGAFPNDIQAEIGGEACEISYAGPQNALAGLDQLNLRLPNSLRGRGEVPVKLTALGREANPVTVAFAP
ncbi:MAG: BACON domain-containing carbohydrate-binding protein [Blastocatellia bacterium]|nr:BACON domain-containing carbohydrate-binding protein [Blastocatellia bacterium]